MNILHVTHLLTIFGSVVLAPIAEEFIFRGLLLTRLSVTWGMPRAILCTSLLFGLLHLEIVGHVFFGYVMAVLYIESRSLYVPILTHAFSNGWVELNSILVLIFFDGE